MAVAETKTETVAATKTETETVADRYQGESVDPASTHRHQSE